MNLIKNGVVVVLTDCEFEHIDIGVDHHFPGQSEPFLKFLIKFHFLIQNESEFLKGIYTRDAIFDRVTVGQVFPLQRTR